MAKKKEKVEPVSAPSKVVNVVFTIPTAFSYESVKVEYSGLNDTNEIVEKYNELVDTFRPKPKPAVKAVPDKPWRVERKQYDKNENEIVKESEQIAEFKQRIKEKIDSVALAPLTTAAEYVAYVKDNFELDLKDQSLKNLAIILEALHAK